MDHTYLIGIRNIRDDREATFEIVADDRNIALYRAAVYVNFHPKYKNEVIYQRESMRVIRQIY